MEDPEDQWGPLTFFTASYSLPLLVAAGVQAPLGSLFSNNSGILFFLTCFCNNICYHFSDFVPGSSGHWFQALALVFLLYLHCSLIFNMFMCVSP